MKNGVIIIGTGRGVVYALAADKGRKLWEFDSRSVSAPAVSWGNFVFAASDDGLVRALDARTGTKAWERQAEPAVRLHVTAGLLFLESFGRLDAVSPSEGKQIWSLTTSSTKLSVPALWKDLIIVGGSDGPVHKVYVLNSGDGIIIQQFVTHAAPLPEPPSWQGMVFLVGYPDPANKGRIQALHLKTNPVVWEKDLQSALFMGLMTTESVVLATYRLGGTVFEPIDGPTGKAITHPLKLHGQWWSVASWKQGVILLKGHTTGELFAWKPHSGDSWSFRLPTKLVPAGPFFEEFLKTDKLQIPVERLTGSAITERFAVVGCNGDSETARGRLVALHLRDGKQTWEFKASKLIESGPTVWGGLVLAGDDSRLYAIHLSTGEKAWEFKVPGGVVGPPVLWSESAEAHAAGGHRKIPQASLDSSPEQARQASLPGQYSKEGDLTCPACHHPLVATESVTRASGESPPPDVTGPPSDRAALAAELERLKIMGSMQPRQILAVLSERQPRVLEALEDWASSSGQVDLYERLIAELKTALSSQQLDYSLALGQLEKLAEKAFNTIEVVAKASAAVGSPTCPERGHPSIGPRS